MLKRNIKMQPMKKKKGQSTVEYIILVAAVLAALIIFVGSPSSPFSQAYNTTLHTGTDGMQNMARRLSSSHPAG